MEVFVQQLINGLTIGAFYALVALGYTMVYGVLKLINFAHGDVFMWGSYIGWTLLAVVLGSVFNAPLLLLVISFVLVLMTTAIIGVVLERVAYRPLYGASRLSGVISALGAAFILQSLARNVWGASYKVYPEGLVPKAGLTVVGNVRMGLVQIIVLVLSILLMAGLYAFVKYTRVGTAMRAVSLDHDTSRLMGVDVNRIITVVFVIGPALGGAAGMMIGTYYGSFDFTLGWIFGLKAFIAAILGGIGNIPGAVMGGFILGIVETLGAGYGSPQWKDVIAYAVLIFILIVRPTGLLGEPTVEKL